MKNIYLLFFFLILSVSAFAQSDLFANPYHIYYSEESLGEENVPRINPQFAPSDQAKIVINHVQKNSRNFDVVVIVDKKEGSIHVLEDGVLKASAAMLYGKNLSDDFPGGSMASSYTMTIPIGEKKVTPAGRYGLWMTKKDPNYGSSITFAQYKDYRLAIHRVNRDSESEKRPNRLMSFTGKDNNISFGCINVLDQFYDDVLYYLPLTAKSKIFILPYNTENFQKYFPEMVTNK